MYCDICLIKIVKKNMMKIPAIVPNDNEGVESGEDDNIEPHPKFEPGVIYE